MVQRDLLIQGGNIWEFVFRVAMLPSVLILTYGYSLPTLNMVPESFPSQMFAGMVGMSMVITGIHGTAVPMMMDFHNLHEVEGRLLALISTRMVAFSKMFVSSLIVLLISLIFMGGKLNASIILRDIPLFILILISLVSASLGFLAGTIVEYSQIAQCSRASWALSSSPGRAFPRSLCCR
ncbi:MAG: hypothetical protein ACFNZW_03215 [Coriobacteriaceae bacterium]